MLQKGEAVYKKKLIELQKKRDELESIRNDIIKLRNSAVDIEPIKQEIYQLQKDLIEEKSKTRALTQELQQPMNVHRWRQLEGSDPQTYQLILKVMELQKTLRKKTEECDNKKQQVEQKEQMINELKKILVKMPTEDKQDQLEQYQAALKQRRKELN